MKEFIKKLEHDTKKLGSMIREPAGKEWFAKHGMPKSSHPAQHAMSKFTEKKAEIKGRLDKMRHVESPREKQIREINTRSHQSGLAMKARDKHERRHGQGKRTSKGEALERAKLYSKDS